MIAKRLLPSFAALAALAAGQCALAQDAACLSEQEVVSLVSFALPTVMESTIKTCRPQLSPQGYFGGQGPALVARFAAGKPANWPGAKAAFLKLGASKDAETRDVIAKLPDSALQPFAEGLVAQLVASKIKPDRCKAIERGVSLIAPLPPQNTAELIAFVIVLADKAGADKASKFSICPSRS
ncbi:hypothetical protein [Novosphingobium sp. Chol11]|uniref:hypothetical protein n=1 Tax=Novosphingobium sp. Chol11 TaxID=1385763 RepID=UPI0025D73575|nr:hypothetical protein [Novosphingobium sp. Chol11]